MLKKTNAILSLLTTVLILDHAAFYAAWLFSGGTIHSGGPMPMVLAGCVVLHGAMSLFMVAAGHKGDRSRAPVRRYNRLNRATVIQRMTGVLMLVLLPLHILGSSRNFAPALLHGVVQPLFFMIVLAHVAVSFGKALITLGIGTAKVIRVADIAAKAVCALLAVATVAGMFAYLMGGGA